MPSIATTALADELLARSEVYLRERGAKVIYAGGIRPLNGFYLGLYGGSELPGVLVTDPMFGETLPAKRLPRNRSRACPATRAERSFGRPCTREQRQLRRDTVCHEEYCPPLTHVVGRVHDRRVRADPLFRSRKSSGGPALGRRLVLGHRAALDVLGPADGRHVRPAR